MVDVEALSQWAEGGGEVVPWPTSCSEVGDISEKLQLRAVFDCKTLLTRAALHVTVHVPSPKWGRVFSVRHEPVAILVPSMRYGSRVIQRVQKAPSVAIEPEKSGGN